jgi:hypothetical protein
VIVAAEDSPSVSLDPVSLVPVSFWLEAASELDGESLVDALFAVVALVVGADVVVGELDTPPVETPGAAELVGETFVALGDVGATEILPGETVPVVVMSLDVWVGTPSPLPVPSHAFNAKQGAMNQKGLKE